MNVAEITTYKEGGAYTHVVELVKGINADILILTGNTKKNGFQKEDDKLYYHIPALRSLWDVFFINPPGSYKKVKQILKLSNIFFCQFLNPLTPFS